MSSNSGTHWCHSCSETVTLQSRNLTCPTCGGGFIQELDDSTIISPNGEEHNNQRPRFMEAVSNFLRQQMAARSNTLRSERGPLNGNSWSSFLVFAGDMPTRMPGNGGLVEFMNETLGFRRENGGDYFIGPGVEEFFEHVTVNDHRAPPPASRSLIEALATVKISKKHVRAESTCAVCKDKFELGSEVKRLPCKHMYHGDCIVPWLEQRSSCPVCRKLLIGRGTSDESSGENSRESSNRRRGRMRWSFLWPFGSTRSGANRNERVETSPVAYHQDNHRSEYSQWPFE
ncbi:hypothetical protein CASFOL_027062 [Castilleja foliolosa]|uniref:RING-type E3 ubiquitin transferase n=1 Tax=Castilleja foliolosa TaxID=1961234 RepID=A0ABD3CIU3_9LAMI